jgi:cyclopropane-fatty-acyl-phospholipid synthase
MTRAPAAHRATPRPDSVAVTIAALATQLGLDSLPVRIRAWDGSEAGPATGPTLVLRSPLALRRLLWHPGELGLAQAYVTGALDVDGDLDEGLRQVWHATTRAPAPAPAPAPGDTSGPAGTSSPPEPTGTTGTAGPTGTTDPADPTDPTDSANTPATHVPGGRPVRLPAAAWAAVRAAVRLHAIGAPLPAPASQLKVSGRRHSRARDRAVIAGHYDLPPEFYRLILDPRMAYSSAHWTSADPGYTLADAQRDKLELICSKLGLTPGARLLDIGCGWGSLTLYAAQQHQAQVTAVTLSAEQGGFVAGRVKELGLESLVDVQVRDYRDIADGGYDAIASVEMGEHVGATQYPRFCAALHGHARPGGKVLIQQMSRTGRAPGGGPFIESFIAADMHMRPIGETINLLEQAGLEVLGAQAMRADYVRTIRAWQDNFAAHRTEIEEWLTREQIRVWELYLAGGALAFEQGRMGVDQILATRRGRS